ncbi:MAG: transketolase, partial [Acidobacteria bacterium]|nr:transketolase [Acidobacteriota bacterium]
AYVLADSSGDGESPELILMGTGSEVGLCVEAYERLVADGVKARVVSIPSWEVFEHQPDEYKESVIPAGVKARVAVEQAARFGWQRYTTSTEQIVGMKTFGASAPLKELTKKFGFTVDNVVEAARREIEKARA